MGPCWASAASRVSRRHSAIARWSFYCEIVSGEQEGKGYKKDKKSKENLPSDDPT